TLLLRANNLSAQRPGGHLSAFGCSLAGVPRRLQGTPSCYLNFRLYLYCLILGLGAGTLTSIVPRVPSASGRSRRSQRPSGTNRFLYFFQSDTTNGTKSLSSEFVVRLPTSCGDVPWDFLGRSS